MFTSQEQPLLTGTNSEVDDFVDASRCMVIDWRSSPEEALDDAIRWVPKGLLGYKWLDDERRRLKMVFSDRESIVELKEDPNDVWRTMLRLSQLVRPEYAIHLFQCSEGSDTPCFLFREAGWWDEFRRQYPKRFQKLFTTMEERPHMWELPAEELPPTVAAKPWWRFW